MSQERFYVLMRQFIEDRIDEQGLAELQGLVGKGDFEEHLKRVFDEVYDVPSHQQDLPPDRVRKILYAIHNSEAPAAETTAPIRTLRSGSPLSRRTWVGWAAAVVLLLAGGWFLLRQQKGQTVIIVRQDLPAGSDKAMLTLSNGKQVTLGNGAKGKLAEQGGNSIVQLDSGQLVYQKGSGPAAAGEYNTLTIPRGGQYRLVLPDGSSVWLNSASSLRYPASFSDARNVELSGEAYFEVAKNSRLPFTVSAGGLKVAVLGTAFNLMAYPDEDSIRTTLVDGSVRLLGNKAVLQIKPGEQGTIGKKDDRIILSRPDLEEVLAWKDGEFKFSGQPIQAIMRQMARWYDVDIEYRGLPRPTRYNGDITRKGDASAVLDMLATTQTVHFKIEGGKIIVMPGPDTHQNQ